MALTTLLHGRTRASLAAITGSRSGSYIFHGARSVGKATAARELARRFNCEGDDSALCAPCRQFEAGNYPDFIVVRPEGKPSILIEQVRGLIQALSFSLYRPHGVRVVLIDDAECLTVEAQNALLKLIEEPPPGTVFILVTERLPGLLPTVRSRCIQVYFPPQPPEAIAGLLAGEHGVPGPQAADLAMAAAGAPGVAITLAAQPSVAEAKLELMRQATSVAGLPLFERLLLAGRLTTAHADLALFERTLQAHLVARLRSGAAEPEAVGGQLEALERFREQLHAKVAPRVAVERLMLGL